MSIYEKPQTLFMLAAIALGFCLGEIFPSLAAEADVLIAPALTAMLFGLFLGIPLGELKPGFMDLKFTAVSLGLNFIWIPILGWVWADFFGRPSGPALGLHDAIGHPALARQAKSGAEEAVRSGLKPTLRGRPLSTPLRQAA